MIALIQRTDGIKCIIDDKVYSKTYNKALLVLLGVKNDDTNEDVEYIVRKIPELRIFSDDDGKMNLSAIDVNASIFVVSQFTLHAKCRKGRRPNFMNAAGRELGNALYEDVVRELKKSNLDVLTGEFGADMNLIFNNNGPVTIILDSRED